MLFSKEEWMALRHVKHGFPPCARSTDQENISRAVWEVVSRSSKAHPHRDPLSLPVGMKAGEDSEVGDWVTGANRLLEVQALALSVQV